MRGHAKGPSARSIKPGRAAAARGKLALAFGGALALILALGVGLASAVVPTVTVEDAQSVSYTSALAKGTVDPQGKETNCHFEYVTQAKLDENVANGLGEFESAGTAECDGNPHNGSGAQAVEAPLTGLAPATVYHLRLVASNEDGQSEAVAANTFETKAVAKPTVAIDPVTTFTATTAHFSGKIEPKAPAGNPAAFDVSWSFQCVPDCPGLGGGTIPADNVPHTVAVDASGLEPNTHYEVTLVATNAGGSESAGPVGFTTVATGPSAATIPAFALEGGHSALVGGRVNPHNSATTYWVEYGTTTAYGTSAPASEDAAAGAGGQDKVVTQEIGGLAAGTVYHYRLVAKNAKGEVNGEDMTFRTAAIEPAESCPNAALRTGPSAFLPDCRAYEVVNPDLFGSSARAVVSTAADLPLRAVAEDGEGMIWSTNVTLPGVDGTGRGDTYRSRRTATGWTSVVASPPGSKTRRAPSVSVWSSPDLSRMLYITFAAQIDPNDQDPVEDFQPLTFTDLYRWNGDGSFTHVNVGSQAPAAEFENVSLIGSTADASKVVFRDTKELEPGGGFLYERSGGQTIPVGLDENGAPLTSIEGDGMSDDGSVVAFHAFGGGVYLRNVNLAQTVHVTDDTTSFYDFESLSGDGSKLFFSTNQQEAAGDTDTSVDLYEYDAGSDAITRISAPTGGSTPGGPGDSNQCSGSCDARYVAVPHDGAAVYFVSREQLDGSKGTAGLPNMYLAEGGTTRFVTTLDPSDEDSGPVFGQSGFSPENRHVRLTPDGSKLIFESRARVSAYDNDGHTEVYVYDPGSREITCASCRPSGDPPTGEAYLRNTPFSDGGSGAVDPVYVPNSDEHGQRIFFQSTDAILPQDVNGALDVYEYGTASSSPRLLSTGSDPHNSFYAGNGLSGRDVFIFSAETLAPQNQNQGTYNAYDARIGGGFPVREPSICEGEACRGAGSVKPPDASPATPNFIGPGNPKPKRPKKHKKKHGHKKHGKHHSKSQKRDANRNGRTGR